MRMNRAQAGRIALFAVAVLALVLLIAGISQTHLARGVPFAQLWQFLMNQFRRNGVVGPAPPLPGGNAIIAIVRTIFFISLICLPIALVLALVDPDMRKRLLGTILRIGLLILLLSLFVQSRSESQGIEIDPAFGQMPPQGEDPTVPEYTPDESFNPDKVNTWITWTLSGAIALVVAAAAAGIIAAIRRRPAPETPLNELGAQAQAALADIQRGADLRDTILRCYVDMTRIVREQRGVQRDRALTAREFAETLVRTGLPDAPVNRLTQLFEKARYSDGTTTTEDEREAIASLGAIADACRSMAS